MVGIARAAPWAFLLVAAAVIIAGVAVWFQGAGVTVRPTTYTSTDTFHDSTSPATILNESRSIVFTFELTMDQPWVGDGFKPYHASLAAVPGADVESIRIGTISVFLCGASCSSQRWLWLGIESLNDSVPNLWTTYEPHFLYSLDMGPPGYITYGLAFTVFYRDGSHFSPGWDAPAHLSPVSALPDNVTRGQAILSWGALLFATACVVVYVREFSQGRTGG